MKQIEEIEYENVRHEPRLKKRVLFTADDSESSLCMWNHANWEGPCGFDNITHPDMEKYFYILSGKIQLIIQGEQIFAKAGDVIQIRANVEHGAFVAEGESCTFSVFGLAL